MLHNEGLIIVKAAPMGGNLVLLSSSDVDEISTILKDEAVSLTKWFAKIRPWGPKFMLNQRHVWLRITGAPIHVWGEEFFKHIA